MSIQDLYSLLIYSRDKWFLEIKTAKIFNKSTYTSYFDFFKKYLNNPSISLYRGPSGHFLSLLPDAYLDFIYIDGDHSYRGIKIDIELARKKVKVGGFICGHDYTPQFPGVIQAVDEFCNTYKTKLELTQEDKCPSYLIVNS